MTQDEFTQRLREITEFSEKTSGAQFDLGGLLESLKQASEAKLTFTDADTALMRRLIRAALF